MSDKDSEDVSPPPAPPPGPLEIPEWAAEDPGIRFSRLQLVAVAVIAVTAAGAVGLVVAAC